MKIHIASPQKNYLQKDISSLKILLDEEELQIGEEHADLERVFKKASFFLDKDIVLEEGLLKIFKNEIYFLAEKIL